jgi:hypothetical protein
MTRITKTDAYGLMEAYNSIYTPSEEQIEIEELGISIVENAANVLFSQGYDVNDLCDYFEKASTEVISEDYLNFAEGQTYISESFIVSDKYVQEQFNILEDLLGASEMLSEAGFMASQRSKLAAQRAANPNPVPKSTPIPSPAKPKVTSSPNPKVTSSTNPKITSSNTQQAWQGPARPPSSASKPGILQRAGNFAKGLMSKAKDVVKKIPGAGTAAKIAKSPVGKFAGKVGSRVLPGVGVVAYGADAAKRFKKGDWGGGLLSTAGAVTSAIPGAGLVAGLAPAAIQAGTDALGLTGDRSKKGPKTVGPKLVGPKLVGPKIVGPKSSSPSGGGGSGGRSSIPSSASPKPSPAKPKVADKAPEGETAMQKWARANPKLADRVKPGQSGYDEISAKRTKPGPNEKQNQTPTTGPTPAIPDLKSVNANLKKANTPDALNKPAPAGSALAKEQERRKREAQARTVNASYEYDAYDLVLEYLLSQGHVDTVEEANYVMLVMDAETIGTIVEEYENDLLAEEITEWVNELVDEGYDLSEYTWDDLAEYYVNEGFKETGYHDDEDPYSSGFGRRNQSRTTSSRGRRIQNRVRSLEKSGDQEKADLIHKSASSINKAERGLAKSRRNKSRGPGPKRARQDAMRDMKDSDFS